MAESMSFEDGVFHAIVEQFFKPSISGPDMNGHPMRLRLLMSVALEVYRLPRTRSWG
jgi:hypothetical protein